MTTRAVRDGDAYVLNGTKRWKTNAGVSQYYTVMTVTNPSAGAAEISAFVVEKDDPGVLLWRPRAQARHQALIHLMLADMAMKVEAPRQLTYAAARSERDMAGAKLADLTFMSSA